MLADDLLKKVQAVLDSNFSDYAIAKYVGDASSNNIGRLRRGRSKIENIKFGKLKKLEEFYDNNIHARG